MTERFDAVMVASFGGPEGPDDVLPFLENVTRGRNVPRSRLVEVAHHYHLFGGVSPINAQNRALVEALAQELAASGLDLPVYLGNRNWHPLFADTLRQMAADGVRRALAFVTSPYSSYSSCRQYLEDFARARSEVGPQAPVIEKLRTFHDHPGFIEANVDALRQALAEVRPARQDRMALVFTAHSIPVAMAERSDYVAQLTETAGLVADAVGRTNWALVWQSASGPPSVPWLAPDILDHLAVLATQGVTEVVVAPIGFVSDHLEVRYDLDHEAAARCQALGMRMVRAATAGTHPAFVRMVRQLIAERVRPGTPRLALGTLGVRPDTCPADCCPPGWPAAPARSAPGEG